jgi:L-alanine-DL-glutamate epimerase-like enolase superfamily enzyme
MLEVLTIPVWAKDKIKEVPPVILGEPMPENGTVYASEAPGLGIKINSDLLPHLKHWNN